VLFLYEITYCNALAEMLVAACTEQEAIEIATSWLVSSNKQALGNDYTIYLLCKLEKGVLHYDYGN
jgi:hypothetical protein